MKTLIQSNTLASVFVILAFSLGSSGCLKTRAQLRDEPSEQSQAVIPVEPVQDVHPHGQYVVDELKEEVTRMEGRLEDLERAQKEASPRNSLIEELKKLEARVLHLEEAQTNILENLKKAQEATATPKDPNELFRKAEAGFKDGKYEEAVELFAAYLKTPNPKFIYDAVFFRGECFYRMKQYKKAIVEFSKFPEKYTKSKHMPEALYKIGLSFDALGMKEDARGFYQELLEKFPKSSEAKKLKKKK